MDLSFATKVIKATMAIAPKVLSIFRRKIPRRTLLLIVEERDCWWYVGSSGGQPAMQIVGRWYATNIIDQPVQILKVRIVKPDTRGGVFGGYEIPSGATAELSVDFWISPLIQEEGKDLKARVEFIDQYGNRHRTPKVKFTSRVRNSPKQRVAREAVHAISDPVEKNVVAVLQAESDRYEQCGRGVGGLGSVQTRIAQHHFPGVGSDVREANSPKQQEICGDPVPNAIHSENCEALVSFYTTLDTTGRGIFEAAMLSRLHRDREYASIGYFIVLVLLRCGRLSVALDKAKDDLLGDPKYGFSDTLRIIDGLLRYEHSSFTDQALDEIERFIDGVKESVFGIPQKLSAVRTMRLSRSGSERSGSNKGMG